MTIKIGLTENANCLCQADFYFAYELSCTRSLMLPAVASHATSLVRLCLLQCFRLLFNFGALG